MSVTNISQVKRYVLWGKAAGRCEYRGCNKLIYLDDLTKREFNQAYIAHIVADSPKGPRGDEERSFALKNELSNLMLLCDRHHRLIDIEDVDGHPEELLLAMKKEHEERIKVVTEIQPDRKSHILIYKANVGKHSPQIDFESARKYLLPNYYPATNEGMDLGLGNSSFRDRDKFFWDAELHNLEDKFAEQVMPKLRKGKIQHLSIFAFAPIPLLIKLGTLINDIFTAEIHQPIREPKSWNLTEHDDGEFEYNIIRPTIKGKGPVAINFSLSATISQKRIEKVLGEKCNVYTISIDEPFNDFLRTKKQLRVFSEVVRKLLDEIKLEYGEDETLNIFPAMPIATALEFGRIWMPKADMPLKIYDQNKLEGGFIEVVEIKN